MILMLAPGPGIVFAAAPSGAAYTSDLNGLIYITNNSTYDQAFLAANACKTLSPFGDWGNRGFNLLSDLYTYDVAISLPQFTVASVFADGTNNGTWAKTGTLNGTGNWTQVATLTLASLAAQLQAEMTARAGGDAVNAAAISAETTRAETQEHSLQSQIAALSSVVHFVTGGPANAATTAPLAANTYNNGALGVGATLTANSNGALAAQDGVTLTANQRLLVLNEAAPANNGLYALTQVGDGGHPYILTRATDANTAGLLAGATVILSGGSTLKGNIYTLPISPANLTVGTTALNFVQSNSSLPVATQVITTNNAVISAWFASVNNGTGAAITVKLPPSPSDGETHTVKDWAGNAAIYNITVDGNGNNIDGASTDVISVRFGAGTYVFSNSKWSKQS